MSHLAEWNEWKSHPVTKEWFEFMEGLRSELKDAWEESVWTGETEAITVQRNAFALGQASLLKRLGEATYEEVEESKSE